MCINNFAFVSLVPTPRLPCMAHIASTSQCRSYGTVSADISGQIATFLSMDQGGMTASLRGHLRDVLLESACVRVGVGRPGLDPNVAARIDSLLALCLPVGTNNKKSNTFLLAKRARLKALLHGDISRDEIVIYAHPFFNVNHWAEDLSAELLPRSIPCFPRTRWCNGAESEGAYTLLANVYN